MSQQKTNNEDLERSFADLEKAMVGGFNLDMMKKLDSGVPLIGVKDVGPKKAKYIEGIDPITSDKGSPNVAYVNNGMKPKGYKITEEIDIPEHIDINKIWEAAKPKMVEGFKSIVIYGTESHHFDPEQHEQSK